MSALTAVRPYVQIARVDHWFKNAFMLLGVVLAIFYAPWLAAWSSVEGVPREGSNNSDSGSSGRKTRRRSGKRR